MESIFETYKRRLCKICKNRNTNLCNIVRSIDGKAKCYSYEKERNINENNTIS